MRREERLLKIQPDSPIESDSKFRAGNAHKAWNDSSRAGISAEGRDRAGGSLARLSTFLPFFFFFWVVLDLNSEPHTY
jgi:hypothetical protein